MTDEAQLNEHPVAGIDRTNGAVASISPASWISTTLRRSERAARRLRRAAGTNRRRPRRVDFVDSTALGVLIEVRTKPERRQAFLPASPGLETHRALTISGLDRHLAVHDTVESALAAPLEGQSDASAARSRRCRGRRDTRTGCRRRRSADPASANGLPAYITGYANWSRLNATPIRGGSAAHQGTKNVYASKRKAGRRYPLGTVVVKVATPQASAGSLSWPPCVA